jgi:Fur family transcriptional regulator, zinc uptake regulator
VPGVRSARVSANSIYRILKALEDDGCARRIAASREWLWCEGRAGAEILLICDACTAVEPVPAPADVETLRQRGRDVGFRAERLVLEVVGRCAACQRRGAST